MKFEQIIETNVKLDNPLSIYVNDEKSAMMTILIDKYVNKCFKGMFIQNIVDIIDISSCALNSYGCDSFGIVGVKFKVSGIKLIPGSLLPDCLVLDIKVTSGNKITISAINDIAFLSIIGDNLEFITVGMRIPVQVVTAKHNPNEKKITVLGVLYNIKMTPLYLECVGKPDKEIITECLLDIENVNKEKAEIINKSKKYASLWEFFDRTFYSFEQQQTKSIVGNFVTIDENIEFDGIYMRDKFVKKSTNVIVKADSLNALKNITQEGNRNISPINQIKKVIPNVVLRQFTIEYCDYINFINNLCILYASDEAMFKKMDKIWKFYVKQHENN